MNALISAFDDEIKEM
jgi:hypothetical protein